MANVNLNRRAEIGREKSAKTRAQLIAAAHSLFRRQAVESVTVDDVVREAGLAKGTFYVHFDDLHDLTSAVADDLIKTFDELLQPARLSLEDPVMRIAFGCNAFFEQASADPSWAAVVARMGSSVRSVGEVARSRLFEDVRRASKALRPVNLSAEVSQEIILGIMFGVLAALGEGRLSHRDREEVLSALLRAIGVGDRQAKSVLAQLSRLHRSKRTAGAGRNTSKRDSV